MINNGSTLELGSGFQFAVGAVQVTSGNIQNGELFATSYQVQTGNISSILSDYTYYSSIGIAANLTESGGGTTVLTGQNNYEGGTTITVGSTLQVGNGGKSRQFGFGGVTLSGMLVYDRSDSFTENNTITGAGLLQQNGTDTLLLSNNSTLGSGSITLKGGTLQVAAGATLTNGVIPSGGGYQVGVNAGQSLGGVTNASSGFTNGAITTASLLGGTSSSATDLQTRFSATANASNDAIRQSDVYGFQGTGSNTFVLQLSTAGLQPGSTFNWLNPSSNLWENAVDGNTGQSMPIFIESVYTPVTDDLLGHYGEDLSNGNVWAVLNDNGQFAAVLERSIYAIFGLGVLILIVRCMRRKPDPWEGSV